MSTTIDEIEQRKAYRVNAAWARSMPDEMLERWHKLITTEYERRQAVKAQDLDTR
jgi:hypothetical protein